MNFSFKDIFKKKVFKEPGNTVVYSTIHVMKEDSLITLVSHELDGDWQFIGNEPIQDFSKIGMLVALNEVLKKDKSLFELANMERGYQATRQRKNERWRIKKI